jgi:drug/metabolite transporter (DMT)-like permease
MSGGYESTMNSILNSPILGYVGAFTAAIFFGSNYVVTKKFPLGDGFAFQWVSYFLFSADI